LLLPILLLYFLNFFEKKTKIAKKKKPKKYVRVFAPFLASFLKNLKLKKCIYYFSDLFVIVEWRRPILKLEIISPSNPFFFIK